MYGRNEFCEPDRTSLFQMFLKSFEDTTLIVLIVAALVSLAVGKLFHHSNNCSTMIKHYVAVLCLNPLEPLEMSR